MAWTSEQAAAYAAANPDVWKSYQNDPQNKGLTLQQAMEGHYNNFGQSEGRAAPTASQEYSTQNLSPYIAAGIQNSTKAYDLNGNPITLGAGQKLSGGSLNGNLIYNANGTSAGQYYTSPEDAAYWKQRTQQALNGTAVAGPQTLEQQRQNLQSKLSTGGPARVINPAQSNILQRLAAALAARRGTSMTGAGVGAMTPTGNSYYSQLAQMLTQRFGGNGITSTGQNGLLKNNSLYSNYLR